MADSIAWFMLASALVVLVLTRIRPGGRHAQRGGTSVAACMGLFGATRLIGPAGGVESAVLILAAALALVASMSFLHEFRDRLRARKA